LHDRGVRLVAAHRADAFVFVEDAGRSAQIFPEGGGVDERRRPEDRVGLQDLLRNGHLAVGRDLLLDKAFGKDDLQVGRNEGLAGGRVERRTRRLRKVGFDVIEGFRKVLGFSGCESHDDFSPLVFPCPAAPRADRGRFQECPLKKEIDGGRNYRAVGTAHQFQERRADAEGPGRFVCRMRSNMRAHYRAGPASCQEDGVKPTHRQFLTRPDGIGYKRGSNLHIARIDDV
jgi:hypothetical protein